MLLEYCIADRNGERYLPFQRVAEICRCLYDDFARKEVRRLPDMEIQEPDGTWRCFETQRENWGGRDRHFFFRQTVVVPSSMAGMQVRYALTPGPNGGWYWGAPQILCYVNGEVEQGMDSNHREIILSQCAVPGTQYEILLDAYCDMYHYQDPLQMRAALVCVDTQAEKLYYDMIAPLEVAEQLPPDSLERIDILNCLNTACSMLELHQGFGCEFYDSLKNTQAYIDEQLYGKLCKEQQAKICAIGHTHIDVAWRWTYRQTRDKTARSFSTALKMLELYPDYRFMSSQPQLYQYLKEDHPELYEKVRQQVKAGRWEVEGGMWVEADTNLPNGESLVRQFLYGMDFFQKEFGKTCRVLWLPDVFGYSAALPQIMKGCGIDYFVTAKISRNKYNKVPYDTFRWQGIDGSEVLSHFICAQEYGNTEQEFRTTYSGYLKPSLVMGCWKRYQQKNLNRSAMMSYGHGDGGGGPEPRMLELGTRMKQGIPGCPQVQFGTVRGFMDDLEQQVGNDPKLPRWRGELYFEQHQGTYTTMGNIKRLNRKLEYLLQQTETAVLLADLLTDKVDSCQEVLHSCWKTVLLNQFHDVLPGSSIGEVFEDVEAMQLDVYDKLNALLVQSLDRIDGAMPGAEDGILVYNPLSFARTDAVKADIPENVHYIRDASGKVYPVQHTENGVVVMATAPAKGCARMVFVTGKASEKPCCKADSKGMENDFFQISFDEDMNISGLYCKQSGRQMVPEGKVINYLKAYEDKPHLHKAWNIETYIGAHTWDVSGVQSVRVAENGPVRCVLEIRRTFMQSVICQNIILYRDIPRIDVQYEVDWNDRDILLRAEFPTDINAATATYDIQFGNVQRTAHDNTAWDFAQHEVCGHKWADLSQDDYGLSILNDCKYGWRIKNGSISLTLIKSTCDPYPGADKCHHSFTYSIYPHEGGWRHGGTDNQAFCLNVPMTAMLSAGKKKSGASGISIVQTDRDNVVVDTVKYAEDGNGIIVRLYENMNRTTDFRLRFGFAIEKAVCCDLLERQTGEVAVENNALCDSIRPYEIKTYRIIPERR